MSSLIPSMFRQNTRSSSLLSKTLAMKNEHKSRTRSQSIHHNYGQSHQLRYLPLIRMGHIIATKLKKHSYFLFCRLEANLKKQKQKSTPKHHQVQDGLSKLQQFLTLTQSKCHVRDEFEKLKRFHNRKLKKQKLVQKIDEIFLSNQKQPFEKMFKYERNSLKIDILEAAISTLLNKKKLQSLEKMKIHTKLMNQVKTKGESTILLMQNELNTISEEFSLENSNVSIDCLPLVLRAKDDNLKSNSQNQSFDPMHKKFVKMQSNRTKISLEKSLKPLTDSSDSDKIQKTFSETEDKKMMKYNRLYCENLKVEVPDLYDNGGLFNGEQFKIPVDEKIEEKTRKQHKKTQTFTENCIGNKSLFESKKPIELLKEFNKSNYTTNVKKQKKGQNDLMAIPFLNKKLSAKSYQNSLQNSASKNTKKYEFKTDRKETKNKEYKTKEFNKENAETRDEKKVENSSKKEKKYQSKLESIKQNRKKRASISGLRIVRDRNHL